MKKQAKGGLPYLQVSLRFDTQSTDDLNVDDLLNGLKDVLSSVILDVPPNVGPRGHEYQNDHVFVGLQPIFDNLNTNSFKVALFDSEVFIPSAVGYAICLLVTNCDGPKCYAIPGLQNALADLGISAEAIGFSVKAEQVTKFLMDQTLRPIELYKEAAKPRNAGLATPSLVKSIGKSNKKNKKNRKK